MMPPPDPTPAPPPVLTDAANPTPPPVLTPPVPQENPWVVNRAAPPSVESLHIEYVSMRALGLRGELVAGRYQPLSYAFSIGIWAFWIGTVVLRFANGNIAAGIALSLFLALLLNVVMILVLFLVRYPSATSTRKLSYTLQPTGLHGRNPQGTNLKPWKSFRSVKRIGDDLILDYGVMATAYMPVEAFRDAASAERFMQAMRDLKAANGDFAVISPELRTEFAASPQTGT